MPHLRGSLHIQSIFFGLSTIRESQFVCTIDIGVVIDYFITIDSFAGIKTRNFPHSIALAKSFSEDAQSYVFPPPSIPTHRRTLGLYSLWEQSDIIAWKRSGFALRWLPVRLTPLGF